MMFELILFSLLVGVVSGSPYGCPNNVTCIEKETCCQTNTGLWACCPIEDGLCCDDGLHCCSKGQTCLPNGNCSSSNNQIFSAIPLRHRDIQSDYVPCPDGSSCPSGDTCCQLSSGHYGCCPIPNAVCCDDHIHCCPHGYACDVEHSRCRRKIDELNSVPCPGGTTECSDGETCCPLGSGEYGCCPLVDAVCCSDHIHCCPHGHACDAEKGQCNQHISIPWFKKTPSMRRKQYTDLIDIINDKQMDLPQVKILSSKLNAEILCPDATSTCPTTSTCCLSSDSTWSCCPIENAVCCSDRIHCCPTHYKCDLHIFKCDHSLHGSIPMLKKEKSKKINSPLSTIQCPDAKSYCPEETTCCELENGSYGCCPYNDATCCSDKIHCCGNGYACDDSGKRCTRRLNSLNITDIIPSSIKLISIKKEENFQIKPFQSLTYFQNETCPDGKTRCSPTTTCCPNKQNNEITYSCCPYSKGVCCGLNGSVCCPNNYICDDKQLSCQLSNLRLIRDLSYDANYNQCGSSDVACSHDQTCCRTYGSSDGEFACCAFPDAQCCEDGRHCCPRGSTCSIQSGGCIQN